MVDTTTPMAGKTVVITGSTSGIGKATAIGLAGMGSRVAITGRHHDRAQAVAAEIRDTTGNPDVEGFVADLSSQTEVRRLAAAIVEAYPTLDVRPRSKASAAGTSSIAKPVPRARHHTTPT